MIYKTLTLHFYTYKIENPVEFVEKTRREFEELVTKIYNIEFDDDNQPPVIVRNTSTPYYRLEYEYALCETEWYSLVTVFKLFTDNGERFGHWEIDDIPGLEEILTENCATRNYRFEIIPATGLDREDFEKLVYSRVKNPSNLQVYKEPLGIFESFRANRTKKLLGFE